MEAVSNITSAASHAATHALWGDTPEEATRKNETFGQEPVSGEKGNVAAGEPYDKGNLEPSSAGAKESTTADKTTGATSEHTGTTGPGSLYNPIFASTTSKHTAPDETTGIEGVSSEDKETAGSIGKSEGAGKSDDVLGSKTGAGKTGSSTEGLEDKIGDSTKGTSQNGDKYPLGSDRTSGVGDAAKPNATKDVNPVTGLTGPQGASAGPGQGPGLGTGAGVAGAGAAIGGGAGLGASGAGNGGRRAGGGSVDDSTVKARKPSLKDKIKAKLHKHD